MTDAPLEHLDEHDGNPTADPSEPTVEAILGDLTEGDLPEPDPEPEPEPDAFRYAHLTDGAALARLRAAGITGSDARSALAAARSWPGAERDRVHAALDEDLEETVDPSGDPDGDQP